MNTLAPSSSDDSAATPPGHWTICEYCGCVAYKPYIPCIGSLCDACELQHPLRRGRPLCLHASVLFCHRLPYRPSPSEKAPLPRFCMLALRPCAVFCKHDLP